MHFLVRKLYSAEYAKLEYRIVQQGLLLLMLVEGTMQ